MTSVPKVSISASNRPSKTNHVGNIGLAPELDFYCTPSFDDKRMRPSDVFDYLRVAYDDPRLTPGIARPFTAIELGRILRLHPDTLKRWARESVIPYYPVGPRTPYFVPSDIKAWLKPSPEPYTVTATRAASTNKEAA